MTPAPDACSPVDVGAKAERTERARIPVRLAARPAHRNDEPPRAGGFPERPMLRTGRRIEDGRAHARSRISVALTCRLPSSPPVPCASARSQLFTCTCGCASPRNCRTASMTLVMPPRLAGWLLHKPPPSVLTGSLPTPEIRLPSATKRPPSPFLQKPEILELHQHGDREAVVDRGILDVPRRHAGLFECGLARPGRAREGEIDVAAGLSLDRLAGADDADQRPRQAPRHLRARQHQCAAAVADHAAVEPVQRIGDHGRAQNILDRHQLAQHGVRIVPGVVGGGDLDPGELLAGGAELMHVPHRAHRVHVGGGRLRRDTPREDRAALRCRRAARSRWPRLRCAAGPPE